MYIAHGRPQEIFVPQWLARNDGKAHKHLVMEVRRIGSKLEENNIEFEFVEPGEYGNDIYKSNDKLKWVDNIEIAQAFRHPTIGPTLKVYVAILFKTEEKTDEVKEKSNGYFDVTATKLRIGQVAVGVVSLLCYFLL